MSLATTATTTRERDAAAVAHRYSMTRPWIDDACEIVVRHRTFRIRRSPTDDGGTRFWATRHGSRAGGAQRSFATLVQQLGGMTQRADADEGSTPEVDRSAAAVSWEWIDPEDLESGRGHPKAILVTWLEARRPNGALDALRTLRDWAGRTGTALAIDVSEPRTPWNAPAALLRLGFRKTSRDMYEWP